MNKDRLHFVTGTPVILKSLRHGYLRQGTVQETFDDLAGQPCARVYWHDSRRTSTLRVQGLLLDTPENRAAMEARLRTLLRKQGRCTTCGRPLIEGEHEICTVCELHVRKSNG